jgi:hypothetical protein
MSTEKTIKKKIFKDFARYLIMKEIRKQMFTYFNEKYNLKKQDVSDMIARILFFKNDSYFFPNNEWIDSIRYKLLYMNPNSIPNSISGDIDFIKTTFLSNISQDNILKVKEIIDKLIDEFTDIEIDIKKTDHYKITNNIIKDIQFIIPINLFNKLNSTIKDKYAEDRTYIIFLTLLRYEVLLDSRNHQLGIDYGSKNIDDYHVELFASPINRTLDKFCSTYKDVDSYYKGFQGSFFQYTFKNNTKYTFNPPYDEPFMTRAVGRLLSQIKDRKNIHVYATIPVWDIPTLKSLDLNVPKIQMEYKPYTLLIHSGYVNSIDVSSYRDYKYHDHYRDKDVSVAHTFTIVILV